MIDKTIKTLDMNNIDMKKLEESAIKAQKRAQDYHDRKERGELTDLEKKAIENDKKLDKWLETHEIWDLKPGELATIIDMN